MLSVLIEQGFAEWRAKARALYLAGVAPSEVVWLDPSVGDLFAQQSSPMPEPLDHREIRIPAKLLAMLETAAQFRCPQRWSLLYQILWRAAAGDQTVSLAGDPLGTELHQRLKSIRREAHHLHAFLRFVPVADAPWDLVAWFEPEHDILHSASLHFVDRLGQNRWMIATPSDAVSFDGEKLSHIATCPAPWQALAKAHLGADQRLWQTYYQSIFNPARLNETVMSQHMPKRFWKNLPEGMLIPNLASQARAGQSRDGQAQTVAQKAGKTINRTPKS